MKVEYQNLRELLLGRLGELDPYGWGRALYKAVGCGPWVSYTMHDNSDVYYGDAPREDDNVQHMLEHCKGIEIGSIVEGSDVEIGPEYLEFPFTDDELEAVIKRVDDEATFYWKRDNTEYYSIRSKETLDNDVLYWCEWTQFETAPTGSFDNTDKEALLLATEAGTAMFDHMEKGFEYGETIDFPGHERLCIKIEDPPDYTY